MGRIFKYDLANFSSEAGVFTVPMFEGTQILYAREQYDSVCVWAQLPDYETKQSIDRKLFVIRTGREFFGSGKRYLGSAHLHGGSLVFHVFEVV